MVMLAFALRLYNLDRQSIWFDEALSALFASQPFEVSIRSILQEGLQHSPLYYIVIRPFVALGSDEFSLRFLSVCFGGLTIPLIARVGLVVGNNKAGLFSAFLLTINIFHIWYSQEARMYTLLALTTTGSMLFFLRFLKDRLHNLWPNLIGLTLCSGISFNTHHFAFFIPLIQFVYLLLTFRQNYKLLRYWGVIQFVAGLMFLPWIITILIRGQFYQTSGTKIYALNDDIFNTFWNFSIGYTGTITPFVGIMLFVYCCLLLAGIGKNFWHGQTLLLSLWMFLPPFVTFILAKRIPIYLDRYLIISLIPFLLLIGLGLAKIHTAISGYKRLNIPAIGFCLLCLIIIAASIIGLCKIYLAPSLYQRTDWKGLAQYLTEQADVNNDVVMPQYYQDWLPLNFYYQENVKNLHPMITFNQLLVPDQTLIDNNQLWIIIAYPSRNPHYLSGECQLKLANLKNFGTKFKEWKKRNQNRLMEIVDFNCVRLYRYSSSS